MAKRRIIIRESDYNKELKALQKQHKSVSFQPLTRSYFEKRATYFALKGKQYLADQYALYDYPYAMLQRLTNLKLHNRMYPHWLVKYEDNGEMTVKAGLRQPKSRLGLLTIMEK